MKGKCLINLTSVDVNPAIAAVANKISYVGVCWTQVGLWLDRAFQPSCNWPKLFGKTRQARTLS
jgi:hypothetical protein